MSNHGWVFGALVAALTATPVLAASFDCRPYVRNRACPEMVICSTPQLSAMDDRMGAAYDLLMKRVPVSQALRLRDEQRFWLDRRNCCGCDASCIFGNYGSRLKNWTTGSRAMISFATALVTLA